MIYIYFNYPNSRVIVHIDPRCANIRQQRKAGQRLIKMDRESLSVELQKIKSREYRFAAEAAKNDLWLMVDLLDSELEMAVAKHVHRQFSKYYKRFSDATLQTHCEQ